MQPPHEELVGLDLVAAGNIDSLPRLRPGEREALAVLLMSVVYQQDHPRDRRTLQTVRDAVCRVIDAIEPGLVERVEVH
jgi:hypothetical protein